VTRFTLAANNGEIGGGEVMLLRTAKVLRQLGHEVTVVAPALADGVGAAAPQAGFGTAAPSGPRGFGGYFFLPLLFHF